MPHTAKLFRNGRSQAVRLPAEYRFEGSSVYIRRDPVSGDVILSRRPESWQEFFELMKSVEGPPRTFSPTARTSRPRSGICSDANPLPAGHEHG